MKALICAFLMAVAAVAQTAPGQPAPEFSAKDINGKSHRLSDYQGKIVVLEACNLDCPFCANHYKTGAMQALQAAVTTKGGIWLVINSTHPSQPGHRTAEAARQEFAAQGMKATAWIDDSSGAVGRLYGLQTTPHLVVIDTRGVVAYQGAVDDRPASSGDPRTANNYVKQAVEALMAGKPVAQAQTKPYGSGVKYAK